MLSRRQQLAGKLEGEEGVKETLAAADAKTLVYDPKFKIDPEKFESDPARTASPAQPQRIGKIPATLSFQVQMRGSGAATTDPDWIKFLKCCGFSSSLLKSINIGAITSGPFLHGETITGGTSGATGRVVFRTVNGASKIYYVAVGSIEFISGEVITGATSGATATSSSVPSSAGREYKPILTSISSLTAGFNQDEYFEQLKGGRGNAKVSYAAGKPGLIDFNFQGVDAGQTDEAFFEDVEYEETNPPMFKDAEVILDAYHPKLNSVEFDIGAKLAQREDVEDEKGILSYAFTGRLITGTLNLEMMAAAAYDLRAKYLAGTEIILDFTLGTETGNKFRHYFSRVQITDIDKADKEGLVNVTIQFQANGSLDKDDDFVLVQL